MPFHIRPFLNLSLAFYLLITLLVLSSGPAYAEWREIGHAESDGGYTVYVDPATVRRKGDLVKMWVLYDHKTKQTVVGSSYLSERDQQSYDCAEELYRFLSRTLFSGNMESGNVVWSNDDEGKWAPVAPGSVGLAVWTFACGKQ